ncbi:FecCD family ABC transporter permease [Clostridium polynesiense]|uniref:FecCD family ABC transporter permease n=1 Tax=Clostridium polynesiense TaxID=1325933 RepID=UPI0005904582|nr:iron ABC transporter permease [Clostridium polynesiense]
MIKLIQSNRKKFFLVLLFIFFIMIVTSIALGTADISFKQAFIALIKPLGLFSEEINAQVSGAHSLIIYKIRLPRIIMAAMVGAGLAVVGVAFQAVFKNPMADPYVLGISSGGALGAALAIVLKVGESLFSFSMVTVFAFAGSLFTAFLVYNIARVGNKIPTINLLLAGIAVSFLLSSALSILMVFNHNKVEKIVFWTLGDLNTSNWRQIIVTTPFILIGIFIIYLFYRDLNLMLTGDESAKSMGIEVEKVKKIIVVVSSLIVAACVAFSGVIGFVGLLIPHMLRMMLGPNHKHLIPFSALGGAMFLLFSDTLARSVLPSAELPVGAVTALIGSPYFIFLFLKYKKRVV